MQYGPDTVNWGRKRNYNRQVQGQQWESRHSQHDRNTKAGKNILNAIWMHLGYTSTNSKGNGVSQHNKYFIFIKMILRCQDKLYLRMQGKVLYVYLNIFWKDFNVNYIQNKTNCYPNFNYKAVGYETIKLFWDFLYLLSLSHLFIISYTLCTASWCWLCVFKLPSCTLFISSKSS